MRKFACCCTSFTRLVAVSICIPLAGLTMAPVTSLAAEAGQSAYMSGAQDFLSGIIPDDGGLYLRDALVYSNGNVQRDEIGGRVVVNVNAQVSTNLVAPVYVTPLKIFGGTYAFAAIVPSNYPEVTANIQGPGFAAASTSSRFGLGDVLFTPVILGWSAGDFHWNAGFTVVAPTGVYHLGGLANTGTNRWSFMPRAALTWLDPNAGWNVSAAFTFVASTENPLTHYQSGDFVHADFAGGRYLSKVFQVGLAGYYEQQITGDSGSGALLGPYKARVWSIGPAAMYTFQVAQRPVTLTAKWTHDFAVQNTFRGDSVTVAVGLKL
jgi:hypothetical protein